MGSVTTVGPDAVRLAFEAAGQVMYEYDAKTGALAWSDPENASIVLGFEDAGSIDTFNKLIARMAPEDAVARDAAIKQAQKDAESYQVEYSLHTQGNTRRWVEERGNWLKIGDVTRLIGVIRIIDEQKKSRSAAVLFGHLRRTYRSIEPCKNPRIAPGSPRQCCGL